MFLRIAGIKIPDYYFQKSLEQIEESIFIAEKYLEYYCMFYLREEKLKRLKALKLLKLFKEVDSL